MMKKLLPAIICAAIFGPLLFIHSCANTTQSPSGGPKDTIPPVVTGVIPASGTIEVPLEGMSVVITFNEYVTIKTATNIVLSPPQSKMPKAKVRGKSVVITFEEPLLENTTYTLGLNNAIADNNEGNMFPGITYVFSTGSHIDSLFLTGTVLDYKTLDPVKEATVLLYKASDDSVVFKQKPLATVKSDDWGFFCIPFLKDTLYQLYAITDPTNNFVYDPETDNIAFIDTLIRPTRMVVDSLPELQKYDMKDTVSCKSRESEFDLILYKERVHKQYIKNSGRISQYGGFVSFSAADAWIDSLWIAGYGADEVITQFNRERDSLLFWVNRRTMTPDTMHVFVSYRKTDSLNRMKPFLEHLKLLETGSDGKTILRSKIRKKKELKHEDTICVYTLDAVPENVDKDGISLTFKYPIIREEFDSVVFKAKNPRQQMETAKFTYSVDEFDLRHYIIRPGVTMKEGYEYSIHIPQAAFRDITGYVCDSLDKKFSLPDSKKLSTLFLKLSGVDCRYLVELLDSKKAKVLRYYDVDADTELDFPYLKAGDYAIRITEDRNNNSIIDPGVYLEHRQPEKVVFFELKGVQLINIPEATELTQEINLKELFK
ncbi:MAG: Ig-like domain-containing protein [Bacteroidales bacterium]|nr:Ig-like domain-containing protein [Bacteroidales bacterium]